MFYKEKSWISLLICNMSVTCYIDSIVNRKAMHLPCKVLHFVWWGKMNSLCRYIPLDAGSTDMAITVIVIIITIVGLIGKMTQPWACFLMHELDLGGDWIVIVNIECIVSKHKTPYFEHFLIVRRVSTRVALWILQLKLERNCMTSTR